MPNPVSDKLFIMSETEAKLLLYTSNGIAVWEHALLSGTNMLMRPASVAPGLYFYTILNSNGHKKTGKLLLK